MDTIARIVAQELNERWGQSFVVENRTGAGGNIGMELVAKAPADGYTLGTASGGHMAPTRRFTAPDCLSTPSKILLRSRCSRR
jgi:tripartite-type tricarboxylate transporter receptor subunit TctC